LKKYGKLDLRCMDCMDLMKEYPENHFDLAIVDPPYGIGESGGKTATRKGNSKAWRNQKIVQYAAKDWDKSPPAGSYFSEVRRVSKHQIIWGANHFIDNMGNALSSPCWVVWYKAGQNPNSDFADCEIAWTSFKSAVRMFRFDWTGFGAVNAKERRIHPTQKPVALYKWLLQNYGAVKCGNSETGTHPATILDTHLGSGSIAIACYYMGFDLTGSELDPDYYKAMMERIDRETQQQELNLSYETN